MSDNGISKLTEAMHEFLQAGGDGDTLLDLAHLVIREHDDLQDSHRVEGV